MNFLYSKTRKKKELFLIVLGLLVSRTVTFRKSSELLDIPRSEFYSLLRTIGFEYNYLDEVELQKEVAVSKDFWKCSFG